MRDSDAARHWDAGLAGTCAVLRSGLPEEKNVVVAQLTWLVFHDTEEGAHGAWGESGALLNCIESMSASLSDHDDRAYAFSDDASEGRWDLVCVPVYGGTCNRERVRVARRRAEWVLDWQSFISRFNDFPVHCMDRKLLLLPRLPNRPSAIDMVRMIRDAPLRLETGDGIPPCNTRFQMTDHHIQTWTSQYSGPIDADTPNLNHL